ncbi:MAG TPA: hypothetical protein VF449_08935, partial [Parvibaculum sp.]
MNSLAPNTPRPALIHPGFSHACAAARAMLAAPEALVKGAMVFDGGDGVYKPYGFSDGIAVIGVYGYLTDCFPYWGNRYVTGYDALRVQYGAALADDEVKGVIFDHDSYGGLVSGCFDFVDWALDAKKASGKPT